MTVYRIGEENESHVNCTTAIKKTVTRFFTGL
jgi:hypothetical protein